MTVGSMSQMNYAYLNYSINRAATIQKMNTISSGYKINAAADNAAGLSISEGMRGQIAGLGKAETNAQNAISLIQTAEGGLGSTADMLGRMRELAAQASNGTYTDQDRAMLNQEFNQLKEAISGIASSTDFNGIKPLDGSIDSSNGGSALTFQIGANASSDQQVQLSVGNMTSSGLGIQDLDISSLEGSQNALKALDDAISRNSETRSGLGAVQNRLESTLKNLGVTKENILSAESSIRDADLAKESMLFTQRRIMMEASTAMMAQSMNLNRQNMMSLLLR